jgi:hypothetical protein
MAGTLTVQNLQGPSSGANANTVLLPSGQTLYAPGHVVQVKHVELESRVTLTSTGFTDINLGTLITPTSTSSKILMILEGDCDNGASSRRLVFTFYKDGSRITESERHTYVEARSIQPFSLIYMDSPSSTSSINYKVYAQSVSGGSTYIGGFTTSHVTFTLMEIAQ